MNDLHATRTPAAAAVRAQRVVVFGLDAVSWDVVDRVEAAMPTLARLRREGAVGTLLSTLPPITPVAWTSMVTGVGPGRHGVYEFVHRTERGWRPVTRREVRSAALDEILERHGMPSILVNLPVSHPGRSRAVRLQDFLSPDPEVVYPAELRQRAPEIAAYRPFYAPGAIADRSVEEAAAEVLDLERRRLAAALYLLRHEPWRFVFYGVTGTDHLQHRALDLILGPGPVPEAVLAVYREVDRALAAVLDEMRPGDLLVVASDHGSAVMRREFFLNEWLVRQGLARWRQAPAGAASGRGGGMAAAVRRAAFALGLDRRTAAIRRRLGLRLNLGGGPLAAVDEEGSAAYMPASFAWPALYAPGADPRQLADRLAEVRDPETGEKVFALARTGEEVYGPDRAPGAPDVVLLPAPGMAVHPGRGGVLVRAAHKNHHKREGILLLYGARPAGLGRDLGERAVEDVAPTVLAALGIGVPEEMEGSALFPPPPDEAARRAVRSALARLGLGARPTRAREGA